MLDKAFIKQIPLDVTLDQRVDALLFPVQGAGEVIDVNGTDPRMRDDIFLLHANRHSRIRSEIGVSRQGVEGFWTLIDLDPRLMNTSRGLLGGESG
jgi:hypothetical protein